MQAPREGRVAIPLDLLAELFPLFGGGRLRHRVDTRPAESLLDAVLAEKRRQLCAKLVAVLAVRHGRSSARASSSLPRTSSTWSPSTPCSTSSSIAASATAYRTSRLSVRTSVSGGTSPPWIVSSSRTTCSYSTDASKVWALLARL